MILPTFPSHHLPPSCTTHDIEDVTCKVCRARSQDLEQSLTTSNCSDGLSLDPPPCNPATQALSGWIHHLATQLPKPSLVGSTTLQPSYPSPLWLDPPPCNPATQALSGWIHHLATQLPSCPLWLDPPPCNPATQALSGWIHHLATQLPKPSLVGSTTLQPSYPCPLWLRPTPSTHWRCGCCGRKKTGLPEFHNQGNHLSDSYSCSLSNNNNIILHQQVSTLWLLLFLC